MALVNFTNLDFDQIKTSIKDYLRSNSNFTDYDFEGSNLSVLIDVLAYNTYISSYNANMVSNEVFIDSATLRENVVSLARNVGYIPKSRKSSVSNISFFVDTSSLSSTLVSLTLKKGTVCSSTSSFGSQNYVFSIPEDITVPVVNNIASFDNVQIYEGTYLSTSFTVNSFDVNQRFIIPNANVDTSTISVLVREEQNSTITKKFNLNFDILEVDSESNVFFIQEIEDQRYELIFGDGLFGKKLEIGNFIEAFYIVNNGENGNNISQFSFSGRIVDNNGTPVSSGISLITTNSQSEGGYEIESVSSIKKYAPRFYSSQNRAVTSSDYESIIARIYPEAESVSVYGGEDLIPPQYGKVFLAVKPFYGPFVPNSTKDNLKRLLRKYSVAGIVPEIVDLKYLYIEINSSIYYDTNFAPGPEYIKTIVMNNINAYSKSSELNKYGSRFKYSKFQKIIDESNSSITSNITKVQIRRDLSVKTNQFAQYEICYGNEFYVKNSNGYNIKSSGFVINDNLDTLYLSDIPNENYSTTGKGSLILFKIDSQGQPFVVKRSVGIIDYTKGEILINAINIISTSKSIQGQPIIQISAIPKSNDVIGLQDLYLQLDINNSVVNMVSDIISSGYDPSGTSYLTTSSYTNGTFIRQ